MALSVYFHFQNNTFQKLINYKYKNTGSLSMSVEDLTDKSWFNEKVFNTEHSI